VKPTLSLDALATDLAAHGFYVILKRCSDGPWFCELKNSVLGFFPTGIAATAVDAVKMAQAHAEVQRVIREVSQTKEPPMPDLTRIREQIAGLACPYPNIIPFREGWECCKARHLAIIDAAIGEKERTSNTDWATAYNNTLRMAESMKPTTPAGE
jgi:hypothetical protein